MFLNKRMPCVVRMFSLLLLITVLLPYLVSCNTGTVDLTTEDTTTLDGSTTADTTEETTTFGGEVGTLGGGTPVLQPDPEKPEAPENPEITLYDLTNSAYNGGKVGCTKITVLSEYTVGLDFDIYADKKQGDKVFYLYLPCRVDASQVTFSATHRDGSVSGPYTVDLSDDVVTGNERLVATTSTYTIKAMQSNLPTVMVQVDEQYVSVSEMQGDSEHKTFAYGDMVTTVTDEMALANGWATRYESEDTDPDKYCSLDIRGRGNTTWQMPKKPYQIRSENTMDLLGMGLGTTYALMANWRDATGARTQLALDLGKMLDIDYTCEQRQVDFFLNGTYMGMYVITEKIEVAPNRVEIDQTEDILFEVDQYYQDHGEFGFSLFEYNEEYHFRIHSPTEPGTAGVSKMVLYEAIVALHSGDEEEFIKYFDLESWARMFLLHLYAMNGIDSYAGSFFFYYNHEDGKLYACSPWDFDYSFGGSHRSDRKYWDPYICDRTDVGFCKPMMEYSAFVAELLDIYYLEGGKETLESMPALVQKYAEENLLSFAMSDKAIGAHYYASTQSFFGSGVALDYDKAIEHLYTTCVNRLEWIETKMQEWGAEIGYTQ